MLKAGRIVALDTTQALLARFARLTVRLAVDRLPDTWVPRVLRQEPGVFHIGLERHAELEDLLAALRGENIAINELSLTETDLEHVFMRIMAGESAAA